MFWDSLVSSLLCFKPVNICILISPKSMSSFYFPLRTLRWWTLCSYRGKNITKTKHIKKGNSSYTKLPLQTPISQETRVFGPLTLHINCVSLEKSDNPSALSFLIRWNDYIRSLLHIQLWNISKGIHILKNILLCCCLLKLLEWTSDCNITAANFFNGLDCVALT